MAEKTMQGLTPTITIIVPDTVDLTEAASVWSTINGYGYVEWLPIEGSPYEL